MIYIVCAIVSGFLSALVQVGVGVEMYSTWWWAVGAPYWLLGGLLGGLLSNV